MLLVNSDGPIGLNFDRLALQVVAAAAVGLRRLLAVAMETAGPLRYAERRRLPVAAVGASLSFVDCFLHLNSNNSRVTSTLLTIKMAPMLI